MDAFALGGEPNEFVAAFEGAPAGMIVLDRRGRITLMNPRAVELAGSARCAGIGQEAIGLLRPADRDSLTARIVELWQPGRTAVEDPAVGRVGARLLAGRAR